MIRCPKCQNQLSENAEFCNFCGSPVNFAQKKTISSGYEFEVKTPQPKKSSKGIIIAVIAVIVALAIGVGGFFIGKNLSSDNDKSSDDKKSTVALDGDNKDNNNEVKNKDLERIKKKGTLVVGVTEFPPMGFTTENGDWSGFDVELAREFAEELGVKIEFKEIEWDNKVIELNNSTFDCVWNGLDVSTDDIDGMDCSDYYLKDSQIIVVRKDSVYNDMEYLEKNMGNITFAVVDGQMGKLIADEQSLDIALYGESLHALEAVASGICEAAILDTVSLGSLLSRCSNLVSVGEIHKTYYVVGLRNGSGLTAEVNDFLKRKTEDGTIARLAQKYGLDECVITDY